MFWATSLQPLNAIVVELLLPISCRRDQVPELLLIKTGPAPIDQLAGVLGRGPFSAGIVITNTSFTPNAKWVASQRPALLRLRDFTDLMRWLKNNFTDEAEWKDIPEAIEVCPGLTVTIRPRVTKLDPG